MAERIESHPQCDCMACRASRRMKERVATSGYIQADLPESDYRTEVAKLRAKLAVKETQLAEKDEALRIMSFSCDLYESFVPEMQEMTRELLKERNGYRSDYVQARENWRKRGEELSDVIKECDALRDELERTRSALNGESSRHQATGIERDRFKERADLLQSQLDEATALATDLNGQLDQLRVTIGKVEDTEAYRDWCFRLERLASVLDNERQRFLAYAAERFDASGGGAGDAQAIVNHLAGVALLNLEDMPDAGYKPERIERTKRYRDVVAEFCKNGYTPGERV